MREPKQESFGLNKFIKGKTPLQIFSENDSGVRSESKIIKNNFNRRMKESKMLQRAKGDYTVN